MDMFLSENDGGAMAPAQNNDILQDSGLSSVIYSLLFTGNSPLDVLRGSKYNRITFEDTMDVKINIRNMVRMETVGTEILQPLVKQQIVKSIKMQVKNTGMERVSVYVNYILPNGSEISEEVAVFENGVLV